MLFLEKALTDWLERDFSARYELKLYIYNLDERASYDLST
jgi:hypothetical protein